jgi:(S)-ureidoglycine aminohydrolase
MRRPDQLVHARTRVNSRFALMPLEGFPSSRLPGFPDAAVRVLASPRLGAEFVQMLIDLPAGKAGAFDTSPTIETFHYVMAGTGTFTADANRSTLTPGDFGLTPPGQSVRFAATTDLKLLLLRKQYEPANGIKLFEGVYGNQARVQATVWAGNPHSLLQTLIPDDFAFDLAMNIFTFDPGFGLPVVETHVMEHGLYFLQGKGVYFLDGAWMEVEQDDFIWMGPFCPQSFYATGPTPSRYLYYKNVNRDVGL